MGSKFSKAVRSHVRADASVAHAPTTSGPHDIDTSKRQDPALQLPVCDSSNSPPLISSPLSRDDLNLATSTSSATNSLQRRNSAPMESTSRSGVHIFDAIRQQQLAFFEQFLAEHQLMAIDYDLEVTPTQPAPSQPAAPVFSQPSQPASEPTPQCLTCCTDLPKDGEKESLKPCRNCQSVYCATCVRKMFIDACRDSTRMPPRCCIPLNIASAKPYLTQEETALFRVKYEEWCTPNPVYCPVPVCSAFIPDRLLPQNVRNDKKRRVDSGVGTPTSETFACPTCAASICTGCRQQAHPGILCNINEFGLDAYTTGLLKKWGYKKCPKCNHGVKRMFGCNHMECRCGAHFCWVCLENINQCDGGCYGGSDDEDEESDVDSEVNEDIQDSPTANQSNTEVITTETPTHDSLHVPELSESTTPPTTPPRNLDGGGSNFWAGTNLNFGNEPQDDGSDPVWTCHHSFDLYTISFATALASSTNHMECVKCWSIVHPTIDTSHATTNKKKKLPPVRAMARPLGVQGNRHIRGPGQGRGYEPPRGLFRADATIGTAPHLTVAVPSASTIESRREVSAMEGVQFSGRPDTTTLTLPLARSFLTSPNHAEHKEHHAAPSVLTHTPLTSSPAHECEYCYIVVCESCKNDDIAAREAEDKKQAEEAARVRMVNEQRYAREEELRQQREYEDQVVREATNMQTSGAVDGADAGFDLGVVAVQGDLNV